jgi:F-type H+-transporting ATPase subunit b
MNHADWLTLLISSAGSGATHDRSIDWFVMGSTIANAVLFFGALAFFLKKPVEGALVARRENMKTALAKAEARTREAQSRADVYADRLANLEQEIAQLVESFRGEAENERAKLEADGANQVRRMEQEMERTIQQEIAKAEATMKTYAAEATVRVAAEILRREIQPEDQRRLGRKYVEELAQCPIPALESNNPS